MDANLNHSSSTGVKDQLDIVITAEMQKEV